MRKYGGVNNQKSLTEIQEAHVISAPGMSKITKKQSKASTIFGWFLYFIVSYIFTDLLIIIITDAGNRIRLPFWSIFVLPSIPFILTLLYKVISTLYAKKHTNHKD